MNVLYDTNALFCPRKLRQLASRPDLTLWGSCTHVFESISDIQEGDEESFRRVRSQMRLMLDVSPTHFMPQADVCFRMGLGLQEDDDIAREWRAGAQTIAAAESLGELDMNLARAREMRRQQSEGFLRPVLGLMLPSINPAARLTEEVFSVQLPQSGLQDLERFLFSDQGRWALVDTWFRRQEWNTLTLPGWMRERAAWVLDSYYLAYRGYVMNIFERNWRPRGNDALDLDLLVSVLPEGWALLTDDRRLLEACRRGGLPRERFADLAAIDPASWGRGRDGSTSGELR